jgi:hypothetical protein
MQVQNCQVDRTGDFVGSFLIGLAVLSVAAALGLHKTWSSLHSLRNNSVTELRQLKSELAARHLIVSHLVDSLPESFDRSFDRQRCREAREQAERVLDSIDSNAPNATDINASTDREQDLFRLIHELTQRIETEESACESQAVSACLKGIEESNRKIGDAVSTYNASAITYRNYLEKPLSAMVARILPEGQFDLFDLNLHDSSGSRDSVGM